MNFNFHPDYIYDQVTQLGFDVLRAVPVSWFRLGLLKRALPTQLLAAMDGVLQRSNFALSPSVFLDLQLLGQAPSDQFVARE